MAKITNQSIPPYLLANYQKIANTRVNQATLRSTAHLNRQKYNQKIKNSAIKEADAIRQEAFALVMRFHPEFNAKQIAAESRVLANGMLAGNFDPDYFYELPLTQAQNRVAYINSSDRSPLLPYGYPLASNTQSVSTYGSVFADKDALYYHGQTEGNRFNDKNLSYYCGFYALNPFITNALSGDIYVVIDATINVTTDQRGSRPMMSLILDSSRCGGQSLELMGMTPPDRSSKSLYWNYEIPPSSPPYFSITFDRFIVTKLNKFPPDIAQPGNDLLCLKLANRPMFGYGFNNCTQVDSNLTCNVRAFAPRKIKRTPDEARVSGGWSPNDYNPPPYPLNWSTDIALVYAGYAFYYGDFEYYLNMQASEPGFIRYGNRQYVGIVYSVNPPYYAIVSHLTQGSVGTNPYRFWDYADSEISLDEKYYL